MAIVLTYHAVEPGPGPLFCDPGLFAAQLDAIVASGARVATVSELVQALRAGSREERTVAITFDDGIASVARVAAPLLEERGLRATVFCVAGHIGGRSDWRSARPSAPRLALATAEDLGRLSERGWEIGSHSMTHAPLLARAEEAVQHEVVAARRLLEEAVGAPVRSYAYPYGTLPSAAGRRAVTATYESAWTTRIGLARGLIDVHAMPRVDAYHLRRPGSLQRALAGELGSLAVHRLAVSARRLLRKDYAARERT